MSRRLEDQLGAELAGLVILAFLVAAWLLAKTFELVARVLVRHPDCRPVWAALACFLLSLGALALTNGRNEAVGYATLLSLTVLAAVAKIAELYYDTLLQQEASREVILDQVLHQPWFSLAA